VLKRPNEKENIEKMFYREQYVNFAVMLKNSINLFTNCCWKLVSPFKIIILKKFDTNSSQYSFLTKLVSFMFGLT
jgi:hypothetical protein